MQKVSNTRPEPAEKGIFKWIVGILLLAGIIGGSFLIYRWWTKPTPAQIQQNKQHKEILNKQIKEIEAAINRNRITLEKAKKGEESEWKTIDEFPESPSFDVSDKELVELERKKDQLRIDWNKLVDEWRELNDKEKNQNKSLWEQQKSGRWQMLTEKLDKSPTIKERFDKFIRIFYQKYGEKKGIEIHEPRIDFYGFGHFYIKEEDVGSSTAEMGHTTTPKGKDIDLVSKNGGPLKITYYPMIINLNQIYLLNHGTIGMDKFYLVDPATNKGFFDISFDKLIETIAHEIAHALQNVKNIDNRRESTYEPGRSIFSQCKESGERKNRNPEEKLLHPDWVAEHTKFTAEIKQIIESSSEYQEFKKWWQSPN